MNDEVILPTLQKCYNKSSEGKSGITSEDHQALIRRRCGLIAESDMDHEPSFLSWLKSRNTEGLGELFTVKGKKHRNPFFIPTENDIFKKRAAETILKQQEMDFLRKLPVHEKSTVLSRRRCCSAMIRELREKPEGEPEEPSKKESTAWASVIKTGRRSSKESLQDYKTRQRQMFLVQYELAMKMENIQRLKRAAEQETQRVKWAEQDLEGGAQAFEEFLKINDQNAGEAVKQAEKETMAKLEKTAEIKKLTSEIMTVKSDISKYQEILSDYRAQKLFLVRVAPPEWREEQKHQRAERRRLKRAESKLLQPSPPVKADSRPNTSLTRRNSRRVLSAKGKQLVQAKANTPRTHDGHKTDSDVSDSDEEPELYFKEPQEMLDILVELEEQNLSYIQNIQYTEEAMDEINTQLAKEKKKMKQKKKVLQNHIEVLQAAIDREKVKNEELQLKSKMFLFGEFRADKQDAMLQQLHEKVCQVYRCCVGPLDCNISTLQMLTSIEHKMLQSVDALELMPQDKVSKMWATKEKEARIRLRDDMYKLVEQQKEERCKLARERAIRGSQKKLGRKLVPRSDPPTIKKKGESLMISTKEQEDYLYFFT